MIAELRHRDPLLFWIGAAMLLGFVVCALLSIGDQRLILGINPWIKPMKFLASVAIFLWTLAWYMPEVPSPRVRSIVRWIVGPVMVLENAGIVVQAARGTTSHFNNATPFDAIIFGLMGIGILTVTLTVGVFLWNVRRDTPAHREGYLWGIRLGIALFILGCLQGWVMVGNNAHTVGAPDGGAGLPFVNWSTQHGDLRIAHFIGLHSMQALPLLGFLTNSRNAVIAASILWLAVMAGVLIMALQGLPLMEL